MAWIEFHDDLWDHYKMAHLCRLTGLEDTNAVGKLAALWHFTLRNAWRDANLKPWGEAGIEAACRWRGEPGAFVSALRTAGFLDNFKVHGWLERAGRLVYDRLRKERGRKSAVERRTCGGLSKATVPYRTVPNRTVPTSNTMPARFEKPTAQEVTAYGASIGFKIDGEKFCAHYDMRGWVPKGSTRIMRDWKAAVLTWKKHADPGAFIVPPRPRAPNPAPEDCVGPEQIKQLADILGSAKRMP